MIIGLIVEFLRAYDAAGQHLTPDLLDLLRRILTLAGIGA